MAQKQLYSDPGRSDMLEPKGLLDLGHRAKSYAHVLPRELGHRQGYL